jgi:hypothetical protein
MSMLFRNWLEEGYYEEDGFGDLTKITDPVEILRVQKEGRLYENDGMGTSKVHSSNNLNLINDKKWN